VLAFTALSVEAVEVVQGRAVPQDTAEVEGTTAALVLLVPLVWEAAELWGSRVDH
jgi:hypothetical protein